MANEEFVEKLIKERYCVNDTERQGDIWNNICNRVANYLGATDDEVTIFHDMMYNKDFLPNSPTLMNAGTETPLLSACFFLPISDCISNGKDGIFDQVKNAALIFKYGGGVGLNFSNLRPSGSKVKSTNGVSSGVISFMKNFNTMTETIKQGGKRRGALMGCLDVTHPEIKNFVSCKSTEGELSNFNISVKLTDEFMKNVENNSKEDLELFNMIIDGIYKNGEPGLLFKDEIERHNPTPELGTLNPNPCLYKNTYMFTPNGLEKISTISSNTIYDGIKFSKSKTWNNGIKSTVKITTNSGYEYITTPDHMFMLSDNSWCEAKYLLGKQLKHNIKSEEWIGINPYPNVNYEILGFEFGDGTFHKASNRVKYIYITDGKDDEVKNIIEHEFDDKFYIEADTKHTINVPINTIYANLFTSIVNNRMIPDWIMTLPKKQMSLFLRGLFSANGTNLKNYNKIQLVSSNKAMLQQVQQMLSLFGIKAKIWIHNKEHNVIFPNGEYICNESYHIVLSRESYIIYLNTIGFIQTYKNGYNTTYKPYEELNYEKVISVEDFDDHEVWDFTINDTHYSIINGATVHNCAEALLLNFESCNLGSINWLNLYTENSSTDHIDWNNYENLIRNSTIFLNRVIDGNHYPLPEIDTATKLTRKIGLGGMGFHDLLLKLGIPYDSEKALEIAKELENHLKITAEAESKKHNFKNTSLTTIAPTGTISIIADVSSGIEPVFNWVITRKDSLGEHYILHPIFEQELKKIITDPELYTKIIKHCHEKGTIQDVKELPESFKTLFKNAMDINWKQHIKMQSVFQTSGVDMSISKTINLPNNATKGDIREAIFMAWRMHCKGITIYRSGSRALEVLNIKKEEPLTIQELRTTLDKQINETAPSPKETLLKRPRFLPGGSYKVQSGCGKLYVTINERNSKPYEVFIQSGGSGGCEAGNQALGRTISLALRNGGDIRNIIKQLRKVKCPAALRNPRSEGQSCADIVGKLITESIPDEDEDEDEDYEETYIKKTYAIENTSQLSLEECPECHERTLIREAGCKVCHICGYNKCG